MNSLTPRETEVFEAICRYVSDYHNFPTHRWIVEETSVTSTSMVAYYFDKLVEKNYLLRKETNGTSEYVVKNSSWLPPIFISSTVTQDGTENTDIEISNNPEGETHA